MSKQEFIELLHLHEDPGGAAMLGALCVGCSTESFLGAIVGCSSALTIAGVMKIITLLHERSKAETFLTGLGIPKV
jgi:hypothetical protein